MSRHLSHLPHLSQHEWDALRRIALALDWAWVPVGLALVYLAIIAVHLLLN